MNKRLAAVASRRLEILEKIEAQRMEMAEISRHFQHPLGLVDSGLKGIRFINSHPVLMAGAAGGFLALRRIGIIGWIQKGWSLLYLSPVIFSVGSKFISSLSRSSKDEKNTDEGHQQGTPSS